MSDDATRNEFAEDVDEDTSDQTSEQQHLPEVGELPPDWHLVTVDDIADRIVGGGTPTKSNEEYWGGEVPWASVKDLNGVRLAETEDYITESGVENSATNLVPADSIIISTRMTVGEPFLNEVDMAINQDMKAIIPDIEQTNSLFAVYSLWDKDRYLKSLGRGTTVDGITTRDLSSTHLGLPSLSEQRKIATLLHTVDEAIQKTEEIIEQGKQIQESLKTDLFTTGYSDWEIKESTEWRCRANQFPRDWEVKPAEELMKITRGASPRPRSDDTLFGGDIPWIKIGDAERDENKRIESVSSYVTEKGKNKSNFVEENTLLVANSGATCGFSVFAGVDGCVHDGWLILRDYDEFNPDFLYHYINWNYDYLQSLSLGSAQTNLSTSLFGRLDIPMPPIEEQNKIVETLDSVGSIISQNKKELEPLHRLKRGLMQDLLSGEVRTTDANIDIPEEVAKYG